MKQICICILLMIACTNGTHAQSRPVADIDSALCRIWESDQKIRTELIAEIHKPSRDVETIISLSSEIEAADAENQKYVSELLNEDGWDDGFSPKAHEAVFLVIDHAGKEFSEKYFPLVQEKAAKGIIPQSKAAELEDRILMRANKKQKYGTQAIHKNGDGYDDAIYIWPVEDVEHVDERRASVGLPSMQEYIELLKSTFNKEIIWDRAGEIGGFYFHQ